MSIQNNKLFEDSSTLFEDMRSTAISNKKEEIAKSRLMYRSVVEQYAPQSMNDQTDNSATGYQRNHIHPGDERIDTVLRYLDKVYRSPQQRQFHKSMLAACLRVFYGDSFDAEKHRATVKYQFENRKQQVLICAPRRMGKTFATALFSAVMAICLGEIEISVFSPARRQSSALASAIASFVDKLGESDRIVQRNEEKMRIRALDGTISKINAYPSATRTLKGVSGTIVILEEMAQIPPEVLFEVVVPLHQLDITSVIGISTITSESNFFTRYLNQKNKHGEPLFAATYIYLACQRCRELEIAHKCQHNSHLLPAWSSRRKRKIINSVMESQEEMLAREIGGVASALHQRAFHARLIRQLKATPKVDLPYNDTYEFMFHAIDPAAAGKSSELAITTLLRKNGKYILIGLDTFPCKSASENHSMILRHCNTLRQDTRFTNALSVFIIENNLGLEADHMSTMLHENYGYFVVMDERDDSHHTGFRTTNSMKMLAVESLREKIMDNSVCLADENCMVCTSRSKEMTEAILYDQMEEFREILKESDVQQPKKFYSGKITGKDDLIMSLLLNVHWSGFFFRSPKYDHYHS